MGTPPILREKERTMNEGLEEAPVLSQREREVLHWLTQGKSSWEIAVILNITERTVNFHVRNIMEKLNAVSRTQAVAIAVETGLALAE
ncbi:MAG: helix-turn-helix transcriptional regulator [Nitrospiraceae bacterium]|nr:MAG: helix-turn-helix transcriptional regulator [Nitrospiraceae bacterium]